LPTRADVARFFDKSPASVGGDARLGYAHLALSLGSEDAVDRLTEELRAAGITVLSGPRRTGDGYYESAVLDPEGNVIELTA
jgi:lactoylglutathione lyase